MIRKYFLDAIDYQYRIHTVCGLLGPRQVGKTTLARQYVEGRSDVRFFDLEKPTDLGLFENPFTTLSNLTAKFVVIDEVQRRPDLFPTLRVLADEKKWKYLILGSASRDLLRQSSESLAGRIGYIDLPPFSVAEVEDKKKLWLRGGLPNSYLANSDQESFDWRQDYVMNLVERDVPNLGFDIPPQLLRRLWMMLAHNHGNVLNMSEIGKSLGISNHTVRRYVDVLVGTFMVRTLEPWFENINKRQVKTPKVYIRDSGLLNALLSITSSDMLYVWPRVGALWEGFALEEVIKAYHARAEECYFWGLQGEVALDLLIIKNGKRLGFEFKFGDTPRPTKSMHVALRDLNLDHLYIIHPHEHSYKVDEKITTCALFDVAAYGPENWGWGRFCDKKHWV